MRDSNGVTELDPYWVNRMDAIYIQYAYFLARVVGRDAQSVIDVGSKKCGYLDWMDWIPIKVSLDLRNPYRSPSVTGIKGDFLTTPLPQQFDLCLCLQVLEHVTDAHRFARRLLETAPQLIISVPYKWNAKWVDSHVHDPVDEEKIRTWFGRDPNNAYVVKEPFTKARRIVCYFDRDDPRRAISKDEIKQRRLYRPIVPPARQAIPEWAVGS